MAYLYGNIKNQKNPMTKKSKNPLIYISKKSIKKISVNLKIIF